MARSTRALVTSCLALALCAFQGASAAEAPKLNVTAIGASGGKSTLECWQLDAPFAVSDTPGTRGSAAATLGNVSNLGMTVLPAGFDGGLHNAPANQ